jgi:hypothetical protein
VVAPTEPAGQTPVAGRTSPAQGRGTRVAVPAGTTARAEVGSPAARADTPAVGHRAGGQQADSRRAGGQQADSHRAGGQQADSHRAGGRQADSPAATPQWAGVREEAGVADRRAEVREAAAGRRAEVREAAAGRRVEVLRTGPDAPPGAADRQAAGCPAVAQRGRMADSCRLPRSDPRRSFQAGGEYAIGTLSARCGSGR